MSVNPDESAARHDETVGAAERVVGETGRNGDAVASPADSDTVDSDTVDPAPVASAGLASTAPDTADHTLEGPSVEGPSAEGQSVEEQTTVTEDAVRVQRSPRYFRFMLTGAILFAVVALILTFAFPENPTYDRASVFGFLLAVCVTVGVALGAVIALLLDRAVTRRAHTVIADRIDVRVSDGSEDPRPTTDS